MASVHGNTGKLVHHEPTVTGRVAGPGRRMRQVCTVEETVRLSHPGTHWCTALAQGAHQNSERQV